MLDDSPYVLHEQSTHLRVDRALAALGDKAHPGALGHRAYLKKGTVLDQESMPFLAVLLSDGMPDRRSSRRSGDGAAAGYRARPESPAHLRAAV